SEVWAFREANRVISPGAESTVLLSLFTQARSDIEKARQQRTELELVQARLARTDPANASERVFVDSTNPAMQKLQTMYSELLLERNNLAIEVTDRHPRLQALDDRLREVRVEMRREVAAQIAARRAGPRPSTPSWLARCSAFRSAWSSPSCRRRSTPRSAPSRTSKPTWRSRCSAWCRTSTRARRSSVSSSADPPSHRWIPRRS